MGIAISKAMLDLRLVIREKQVFWVCIAHPKHIWHPNLLREYPDFTSHCVKVVSKPETCLHSKVESVGKVRGRPSLEALRSPAQSARR